MFHRPRNPSPPDDDFDFFRNMCITFLKPSHSVQTLNIDTDIFHKNLFISPPVSEDERQSSRNKVTDANLESSRNKVTDANSKVSAPSHSIHERTSEPVLSTLSYKKQMCHADSEDISTEGSRSIKRYKIPKKKASYEDSDSDTLSGLSFRFDDLKSRLGTEQNLYADETASVHGTQCVKPRNLKLYPDKEIFIPKSVLRAQKRAKHDGSSQVKENFKSSSLEHDRASKKKSEKSVSKHMIAAKSEPFPDGNQKRHHKSSKRKKKKLAYSDKSDSDELEASKSRKHRRSSQIYKDISESEDSDNAANPRKKSQTKSYKKQLKNFREYDYSDTELNSRSERYRKSSKKYKKECDLSDSDRSNSRGSSEPDRRYRYSYRNEYDTPDSDTSNTRKNSRVYDKYQRIKQEPVDELDFAESKYRPDLKVNLDWEEPAYFGPDSFYCKVCQIPLNSESTYESHMNGKKHKKAVAAQRIPEIVKGSLNSLAQSREGLRPPGFRNTSQVVPNGVAVLQSIADNHMENPVAGLQFVTEIHTGKEISYYCGLCEAPCMTVSIMPHLLGFKHQLHCVREFFFNFYCKNKERPKKEVERQLISLLYSHERQFGRGKIVVVQAAALPDSKPLLSDEAGPSWRNSVIATKKENEDDKLGLETIGSYAEFDAIQNDYYCKICDAHMNNRNMFAAHMVGKRHLKNVKKTSGERTALALKGGTRAPNLVSDLETSLVHNQEDVIVGLSFIRETKTENGPLYNCYLCGSSCTVEIVEHLTNLKHRIKYLETVNQNGSIPNAITSISELEVNVYTREALVLTECEKIEKEHGRGKVEVYVSKTAANYLARW